MKTLIIISAILVLALSQAEKCDCQPNLKGDIKGNDPKTMACVDPTVENCEAAAPFDSTKCGKCRADFYPDIIEVATKCTAIPDADKVDGCKYYKADKKCMECLSGKGLGSDEKCGKGVDKCFVHSGESTALKCQYCDHGYKLNTDKTGCEVHKIDKCKIFDITKVSDPTCLICELSYYFTAGKCTKHTIVDKCELYDFAKDACISCELGYFKSTDGKSCKKLTVDKCTHSLTTIDKCDFCDNFAPKADLSECSVEVTDKDANCSGYGVNKKCGQCKKGYGIDGSGKCTNKCPTNDIVGGGSSNSQIITFSMILLALIVLYL